MSELNLNETTLDLFENFSKNRLNEHDSNVFRNRLTQDPVFNAAYETFLMSKAVINEKIELNLREQMKDWGTNPIAIRSISPEKPEEHKIINLPQRQVTERRINWTKWIAAASVLFVLVVGYKQYSFYQDYTNQLLHDQVVFDSRNTRSEPSPPSRINIDKILQSLGDNPKTDAIENAISELSKGNTMDSNYVQAQIQIGNLYTHLGNWPMAEKAYINGNADKNIMDMSEVLSMMKSKQTGTAAFKNKLDQVLHDTINRNDEIFKQIQTKTSTIWWKLYN